MRERWSVSTIVSLVLSIVSIVGVISLALVSCATPAQSQAPASPAAPPPPAVGELQTLQESFRVISQAVSPSVVRIDVRERVTQDGPGEGFPFFDYFFGQPDDEEPGDHQFERDGIGSGVVVSNDRRTYYVLTNDHVVGAADSISVILSDGSELDGELVGRDPRKDLAMVSFRSSR